MIKHTIPPIYNENSKILILGSFPSVKSREAQFFYGHPQNRFWKVLAGIYEKDLSITVDEKKTILISNGIALWDVIESCEITGSADSTIKNVKVNDLSIILNTCDIQRIYVNGKKSEKLYNEYIKKKIEREAAYLPSTSSANAQYSLSKLISQWSVIKNI